MIHDFFPVNRGAVPTCVWTSYNKERGREVQVSEKYFLSSACCQQEQFYLLGAAAAVLSKGRVPQS